MMPLQATMLINQIIRRAPARGGQKRKSPPSTEHMMAVLLALSGLRARTGVDTTPMAKGSRASEGGFIVASTAESRAITERAVWSIP